LRKKYAKENNVTVKEKHKKNIADLTISNKKSKIVQYKCICCICGNEFYSTHKHSTHCSPRCAGNDPEVKQKLRDKVEERKKAGTFSG
jgi:hypothetical protein